jgi:hypothetical protein
MEVEEGRGGSRGWRTHGAVLEGEERRWRGGAVAWEVDGGGELLDGDDEGECPTDRPTA